MEKEHVSMDMDISGRFVYETLDEGVGEERFA